MWLAVYAGTVLLSAVRARRDRLSAGARKNKRPERVDAAGCPKVPQEERFNGVPHLSSSPSTAFEPSVDWRDQYPTLVRSTLDRPRDESGAKPSGVGVASLAFKLLARMSQSMSNLNEPWC